MGFILGILESIAGDEIKKGLYKLFRGNNGCLSTILWVLSIISLLFFALIIYIIVDINEHENIQFKEISKVWNQVEEGDSLFFNYLDNYSSSSIHFYKKGRKKLSQWEQKKIKYSREDTISFEAVNDVHEKYFFQNKTSFLGICIGIDSTKTELGDSWLIIKPSYEILHPPKPKDRFDYEVRKWKDPKENFDDFKLSKEFYVRVEGVLLENNDTAFK